MARRSEWSAGSSLSERLSLRFLTGVTSDGLAAVLAAGGGRGALAAGSGAGCWAEDAGEGEAGEFGVDGSAGAMGGVVSVSFARTSACLHVPADDAGIGRWRRWASRGGPGSDYAGTMSWLGRSWSCSGGLRAAVACWQGGMAVESLFGGGDDGRREQRRDAVDRQSVRCSRVASSGAAPGRQRACVCRRVELAVLLTTVLAAGEQLVVSRGGGW